MAGRTMTARLLAALDAMIAVCTTSDVPIELLGRFSQPLVDAMSAASTARASLAAPDPYADGVERAEYPEVMRALGAAGYALVSTEPTEKMVKFYAAAFRDGVAHARGAA